MTFRPLANQKKRFGDDPRDQSFGAIPPDFNIIDRQELQMLPPQQGNSLFRENVSYGNKLPQLAPYWEAQKWPNNPMAHGPAPWSFSPEIREEGSLPPADPKWEQFTKPKSEYGWMGNQTNQLSPKLDPDIEYLRKILSL